MSVLEQVLADAQPGYEKQVLTLLQRLYQRLGEAADQGDKAAFVANIVRLLEAGALSADDTLQVLADISALSWWTGLTIDDEAAGALGVLARRTYHQGSSAIRWQLTEADPAALRRHVMFAGSFVNRLHSPTAGAIDYIRALVGDCGCEAVEVYYQGSWTPELEAFRAERLGAQSEKVRFHSMDADPDFLLHAVQHGPGVFHIWCEAPIASHISLVALFGPTVMFTCGDAAPIQFADAYWYCQDAAYIEDLWRRRGAPEGFIANYRALESAPFPKTPAAGDRTRADLGFGADEIVLVTAGNRLSVDMDQAFVDGMGGLVLSDPGLRWVIVGPLAEFWVNAFTQVLGAQFTHIRFDADLPGLLRCTDIFANPFRAGGGNTALMAIEAGAVTVTREEMGDVRAFTPAAHWSKGAEAYFDDLRALIADPAFRAARLAEQQALLDRRLDQDLFAAELKALCALAFERFQRRLPTNLDQIYAQEPQVRRSGRPARLR